jgi:pyridoxal phosphate enzyme (YggS family)
MTTIAERWRSVEANVAAACARAGRARGDITIVAVSKTHPAAAVADAIAAGATDFGENYAQELADKRAAITGARWHFIGRLQRNKAKDAAVLGCAVDSVDSLALAEALDQRARSLGRTLELLVQVNVDREPQKAGALPEAVPELFTRIRALPAVDVRGLMAIPRDNADAEQVRPAFAALRMLATQLALPELSMGMSDDLEVAVEEGATMVRVGTAIFGSRPARG